MAAGVGTQAGVLAGATGLPSADNPTYPTSAGSEASRHTNSGRVAGERTRKFVRGTLSK